MTKEKAMNVHQRLANVMGDVSYVQKDKKDGMKYTVVSHDKVTALVRPALLQHGIVYYPVRCEHAQNGNRAECSMTVRFVNIDAPDDFIDVPTFGYGIDTQDKGPGKAMSYAVKYALLKALGLETGDDPDNESRDHEQSDPHGPPFDPRAAADRIIKEVGNARSQPDLKRVWQKNEETYAKLEAEKPPMALEVKTAIQNRRSQLGGNNPQSPLPDASEEVMYQ